MSASTLLSEGGISRPVALVTGGAGFIGSHLVAFLLDECIDEKWRVVVLDDFSGCENDARIARHHANDDFRLVRGSILHDEDLEAAHEAFGEIHFVFHFAAKISVPESMDDPTSYANVNVVGTSKVMEASARWKCHAFVLSSTAAVYGDDPVLPKKEDMPYAGKSPYAASKYACELFASTMHSHQGLRTVCLRYFNVFGEGQNPNSAYAAVFPRLCDRAVHGEKLPIFGDGEQTRDFVYVGDVIRANRLVAITPGCSGVYNVGYGNPMSVRSLAGRVLKSFSLDESALDFLPERVGDIRHSYCDPSRLFAAGWAPSCSLDEALDRTVDFLRKERENK